MPGLGDEEIAELLQVSTRTVGHDWIKARLYPAHELGRVDARSVGASAFDDGGVSTQWLLQSCAEHTYFKLRGKGT